MTEETITCRCGHVQPMGKVAKDLEKALKGTEFEGATMVFGTMRCTKCGRRIHVPQSNNSTGENNEI